MIIRSRARSFARHSVPLLSTVSFAFLGALPFSIWGLRDVMPYWALIAVCFWAIYSPHQIPIYSVFLIGLLMDALAAAPFGLHAFVYIAVYWFIQTQRRFFLQASFLTVWFGVGIIILTAGIVSVILMCLMKKVLLFDHIILIKTLTTIAIYPWVAWLLMHILPQRD